MHSSFLYACSEQVFYTNAENGVGQVRKIRKMAKKYEEMIILVKTNRFSCNKRAKPRKISRNIENFIRFFIKMYCIRQMTMLEYKGNVGENSDFYPQNGGKGWNNGIAWYLY